MRLLFLDTETGGLNELEHSLLTIGMVVWENGKILAKKEIWISRGKYYYDEEAMQVNHIDLEELKKYGIYERNVLDEINVFCQQYFGTDSVILAGHNIKFDIAFLKQLYLKYNVSFHKRFHHKTIDTVSILKFLVIQGKIPTTMESFDKLIEFYQIPVNGRHTALGDALATANLFTKLIDTK